MDGRKFHVDREVVLEFLDSFTLRKRFQKNIKNSEVHILKESSCCFFASICDMYLFTRMVGKLTSLFWSRVSFAVTLLWGIYGASERLN